MGIKKPLLKKEQAYVIERIGHSEDYTSIPAAINCHNRKGFTGDLECLNDLTPAQFSVALLRGYEIEKKPEDRLREVYESRKEINWSIESKGSEKVYSGGFIDGMLYTLDELGEEIEGINKEDSP